MNKLMAMAILLRRSAESSVSMRKTLKRDTNEKAPRYKLADGSNQLSS